MVGSKCYLYFEEISFPRSVNSDRNWSCVFECDSVVYVWLNLGDLVCHHSVPGSICFFTSSHQGQRRGESVNYPRIVTPCKGFSRSPFLSLSLYTHVLD